MESLLEYLIRQKDERAAILNEYSAARAAFETAKARLDSFGDITPVRNDIEKLAKYIEEVSGQEYEADQSSDPVVTEGGNGTFGQGEEA